MATRQELLKQLEEDVEELVEINEEEPRKSKSDKKAIALLLFLLIRENNEDVFSKSSIAVLNKGKLSIPKKEIVENFIKDLKKRNKIVNYRRMVKKHATIYNNQLKKEGLKQANKKFKKRANNILLNETSFFRDKGKLYGAKEVDQKTDKTVFKQWVWGMYGIPEQERETHLDASGQIVSIDSDFFVSGVFVSAPREFGDPAEDINCHCGVRIIIR